MSDNTIPEYLQPALAQLEKARAAHLENARLMDETVTAIERAEQEKNALAQADGNDADDWRTAFRAAGGVLSDELKQREQGGETAPHGARGTPGAGTGI